MNGRRTKIAAQNQRDLFKKASRDDLYLQNYTTHKFILSSLYLIFGEYTCVSEGPSATIDHS